MGAREGETTARAVATVQTAFHSVGLPRWLTQQTSATPIPQWLFPFYTNGL